MKFILTIALILTICASNAMPETPPLKPEIKQAMLQASSRSTQMGYPESILVGIISGIVASFLSWVIYRFLSDTIVPWYQTRLYRGILVNGTWIGSRNDNGKVFGFSLQLHQRGHNVDGYFTAKNKKQSGEETEKTFKVQGEITNNYLLLCYSPANPHIYGSGAFLLQIFNAGAQLRGGMMYLQTRTGLVGAVDDIMLVRVRS